MSELAPRDETLRTYQVHDRSLADWHRWLITDTETGENNGYLSVPCSRWGRTAQECAWVALALEVIYVEANGSDDDPEVALDHLMGLVVNDHEDVGTLLVDYHYCLPACLVEVVGELDYVKDLIGE